MRFRGRRCRASPACKRRAAAGVPVVPAANQFRVAIHLRGGSTTGAPVCSRAGAQLVHQKDHWKSIPPEQPAEAPSTTDACLRSGAHDKREKVPKHPLAAKGDCGMDGASIADTTVAARRLPRPCCGPLSLPVASGGVPRCRVACSADVSPHRSGLVCIARPLAGARQAPPCNPTPRAGAARTLAGPPSSRPRQCRGAACFTGYSPHRASRSLARRGAPMARTGASSPDRSWPAARPMERS